MTRTSLQNQHFHQNNFSLTGGIPARSYHQGVGSTMSGTRRFYSPDYRYWLEWHCI